MGDNINILFVSMGFMALGNATKLFSKPRVRYFSEFGDISLFLRFLTNFTYISTILAHKIKNGAYLIVVLGIANALNNSQDSTRGIIAKLGDFQLIFCGFLFIFTIFALF